MHASSVLPGGKEDGVMISIDITYQQAAVLLLILVGILFLHLVLGSRS
jgi:hypothetical protein